MDDDITLTPKQSVIAVSAALAIPLCIGLSLAKIQERIDAPQEITAENAQQADTGQTTIITESLGITLRLSSPACEPY